MGYRFNLQHINWLAALIDPYRVPRISDVRQFKNGLSEILHHRQGRFLSSTRYEFEFRHEILRLVDALEHLPSQMDESEDFRDDGRVSQWYEEWRRWSHFNGRFFQRPWTACIIPSGTDEGLDRELCSYELLRTLVDDRPEHRGLILQPDEPPTNHFTLLDAIPALSHALNRVERWPGLLVWSSTEATFLPIGRNRDCLLGNLRLAMNLLYDGVNLSMLEEEYGERVGSDATADEEPVHLIQLSDVHIGSKEAGTRLRHLTHLVRTLRADLGRRTIPVISGDLFDTPNTLQSDNVVSFIEDIERAVGEKPFCVVGNHDLRKGGWGLSKPGPMMETHTCDPLRAFPNYDLTLVGFNSCQSGSLARGKISETQLHDRNARIDKESVGMRIGVVHHHPTKVAHPEWEFRPFYERLFSPLHAPTVEMVNGDSLLRFCEAKHIGTIIHGHKHIPRFDDKQGVRIVGCGSSVGKIKTRDGQPYLSVNVLTVFPKSGRVISRLLADRTNAGLNEQTRHEFVSLR